MQYSGLCMFHSSFPNKFYENDLLLITYNQGDYIYENMHEYYCSVCITFEKYEIVLFNYTIRRGENEHRIASFLCTLDNLW